MEAFDPWRGIREGNQALGILANTIEKEKRNEALADLYKAQAQRLATQNQREELKYQREDAEQQKADAQKVELEGIIANAEKNPVYKMKNPNPTKPSQKAGILDGLTPQGIPKFVPQQMEAQPAEAQADPLAQIPQVEPMDTAKAAQSPMFSLTGWDKKPVDYAKIRSDYAMKTGNRKLAEDTEAIKKASFESVSLDDKLAEREAKLKDYAGDPQAYAAEQESLRKAKEQIGIANEMMGKAREAYNRGGEEAAQQVINTYQQNYKGKFDGVKPADFKPGPVSIFQTKLPDGSSVNTYHDSDGKMQVLKLEPHFDVKTVTSGSKERTVVFNSKTGQEVRELGSGPRWNPKEGSGDRVERRMEKTAKRSEIDKTYRDLAEAQKQVLEEEKRQQKIKQKYNAEKAQMPGVEPMVEAPDWSYYNQLRETQNEKRRSYEQMLQNYKDETGEIYAPGAIRQTTSQSKSATIPQQKTELKRTETASQPPQQKQQSGGIKVKESYNGGTVILGTDGNYYQKTAQGYVKARVATKE